MIEEAGAVSPGFLPRPTTHLAPASPINAAAIRLLLAAPALIVAEFTKTK
jgi:hypothetical protein